MQRFTDLHVWHRGFQLTLDIYRLTATFPREERFGLTAQMRRAAVSVAANIAEGAKRDSNPDYSRFLNIAEASVVETECLLRIAGALPEVGNPKVDSLVREAEEISRMLYALRQTLV